MALGEMSEHEQADGAVRGERLAMSETSSAEKASALLSVTEV